jgi:hypothetical protein
MGPPLPHLSVTGDYPPCAISCHTLSLAFSRISQAYPLRVSRSRFSSTQRVFGVFLASVASFSHKFALNRQTIASDWFQIVLSSWFPFRKRDLSDATSHQCHYQVHAITLLCRTDIAMTLCPVSLPLYARTLALLGKGDVTLTAVQAPRVTKWMEDSH